MEISEALFFELLPQEAFDESALEPDILEDAMAEASLDELQRTAIEDSQDPRPPRANKQAAHFRSSAVRAYVLERASGVCEACGVVAPFVTEAGRLYLEPHTFAAFQTADLIIHSGWLTSAQMSLPHAQFL